MTSKKRWASAACGLALAGSPPAAGQEAPVRGERIEITGSRIASSDLEGASPVVKVTAEDIRVEGHPSIELTLNNLPQVRPDQGNRVNAGTTGTSTVDLRGLGATRTLVLVNGRRLPAGNPRSAAADLYQVPLALIQRVDVLTGGASAVYGSDAIGGVVNFILDRRFEGVRGEVGYDFYNHRQQNPDGAADALAARAAVNPSFSVPGDKSRDGESARANLTLGHNFAGDKGNATLFLEYLKTRALTFAERDYSACSGFFVEGAFMCGGSGNSTLPARVIDLGTGISWTPTDEAGSVRRWNAESGSYNFAPRNFFQRSGERYVAHARAEYELGGGHRVYGELNYHDYRTAAQLAESGTFLEFATVRFENPLLSPAWRSSLGLTQAGATADVLVGRRNVEGGGRRDEIHQYSWRELAGIKGNLGTDWRYDLFQHYGKVEYRTAFRNDFSLLRASRALDVVAHPSTGAAVCASVLDGTDPRCVPYDVWRAGGVTSPALDYLTLDASARGYTSQQVWGVVANGDLGAYGVRFPGSAMAVEVALGAERRTEKLQVRNDPAYLSGELTSPAFDAVDVDGSYSVTDLFAEARVPVSSALGLSASYRHSDYDTGQATNTFGFGFELAPIRAMRLRGSYQRAVRAANIVELFMPLGLGPGPEEDPCAGRTPTASLAQCQRTGVTAAQYGAIPASEGIEPTGGPGVYGGNVALAPEAASTSTIGVILVLAKGLEARLDYFDMRIEDKVGITPPEVTLAECLRSGEARLCSLIRRDPATGALWLGSGHTLVTNQNIGNSRVSGVDVGIDSSHALGAYGHVAFSVLGSWLQRWEEEPYPGASAYDCAGLFGNICGGPRPHWRHRARATWATPWGIDAVLTWRHIGPAKNEAEDSSPQLAGSSTFASPGLKAANYLDLAAAWKVGKGLALRVGVNNVLDRSPPLLSSGTIVTTHGQFYDALGRHVYATLTGRF